MRIIGTGLLHAFCQEHSDCRDWIENWIVDVKRSIWTTPQAAKDRYASVSFLADNVAIFNVKGNSCRLEVQIAYKTGTVLVKWIGTHAEYSRRYR